MSNYIALGSLTNGFFSDNAGNVQASRSINVYLRGTTTMPAVYPNSDGSGTALTQPLLTDANGYVPGYVASLQPIDFYDNISGIRKPAEPISANDIGELGYAELTADYTLASTLTDVGGLSLTIASTGLFPILLIVDASYGTLSGGAGGTFTVAIREGTTTLASCVRTVSVVNAQVAAHREKRIVPTAGSHTYKISAQYGGSGTAGKIGASTTDPFFFQIQQM